ncbi:unnamed protein product [Peniophora sp. CBMAI 1063]|nr:unnamed protein product [Peniophora sp. CBMAI 1063]
MSSAIFTHPEVPFGLKLQLALAIPLAAVRGVISNVGPTRRSWKRAVHLSIVRAVLRKLYRGDPPVALKLVGGSTGDTYRAWASARGLPITSEESGEGGRLHWIGEKRLKGKVLLFFHGGGYAFPAANDCYNCVLALKQDAEAAVGGLGVAFLEYSLIPAAPFPAQLRQATAALSHILSQGVSTADIVLGGDSAGGNLALQLCSHILHPLSDLPSPPQLSAPLAGIALISPWTSFHDRYDSFKTNASEDAVPPRAFTYLAATASRGVTEKMQHHLEPATAPSGWWAGISDVASRMVITMGDKECLYDQDMEIAQSLSAHTQVEKVVQTNGVHEDFIFAFGAGPREGRAGDDYKAVVAWLKSVLS